MRAKELKEFLAKVPDDTEILIRCQNHERPPMGTKETVEISSITPTINNYTHKVMFNPSKTVRLMAWCPDLTDFVSCDECVRCARIKACVKKGRQCEGCTAVCECKNCGHYDITSAKPFSEKPKFERDTTK